MNNEYFLTVIKPSISDPEVLRRMVEKNKNSKGSKQNMLMIETAMRWASLMEENIETIDADFIKKSFSEVCPKDIKLEHAYYLCKSVLMQFWTHNDIFKLIKIL